MLVEVEEIKFIPIIPFTKRNSNRTKHFLKNKLKNLKTIELIFGGIGEVCSKAVSSGMNTSLPKPVTCLHVEYHPQHVYIDLYIFKLMFMYYTKTHKAKKKVKMF